jgi:hypothetical protein
MDYIDDIWQNYDATFKDAILLFKDKAHDFFDIKDLPPIKEPLSTEDKEVLVSTEFSDATFRLGDEIGMHFEEEVDLSFTDLLRFCRYNVDLELRYGFEFVTVILTKKSPSVRAIKQRSLKFTPIIRCLGDKNADTILAELRQKVNEGKSINELDLIYLPFLQAKIRTASNY